MPTLGIDIGGSAVKAACQTSSGCWSTATSSRYSNPSRAQISQAIKESISGFEIKGIQYIGMCLPGRMNSARSGIERSVNIPTLNGWDFSDLIESAIGNNTVSVRIVSDADAAGYDYATEFPSPARTAAISLGTGVGLCILDGDEILTIGQRGIGHLGQMDVGRFGDTDRVDRDGSRNTLESFIGAPALQPWMSGSTLDLTSLTHQDSPIRAIVHALRVVHAIYQPSRIALLGGVGLALKPHKQLLIEMVNDGLTPLANPDWSLDFASSAHHAARGAAKLAAQSS